jgi:hypothetical protein
MRFANWLAKNFVSGVRVLLLSAFLVGLFQAPLMFQGNNTNSLQAASLGARSTNWALQFDGVDDYVRVEDIGNFDFTSTLTLEAWVKPNSVAGTGSFKGIISGRQSSNPNSTGGWIVNTNKDNSSKWALSICTPFCNAAISPTGSLIVGEWAHIAATYDGSTIKIYQDGTLIGSTAQTGDVSYSTYLFIGAWGSAFNGIIDEVRVWNIARTQDEIQSTMNGSLIGDETGLVGYWTFDEGSGQITIDGTGLGQYGQLGELSDVDSADPSWVFSDVPIGSPIPPVFELIPSYGGLGTEIGARSAIGGKSICGWEPGEIVELWWDDPKVKIGTFVVEADGCFQGLFRLDNTEELAGSLEGLHYVSALGSVTGQIVDVATFYQMRSQLHLTPASGPSNTSVRLSGCDWPSRVLIDLLWSDEYTLLGQTVSDESGCLAQTITIPEGKDGIIPLYAFVSNDVNNYSGAAFWRQGASIVLTPPEGPAGAHVPMAGSNWAPNEDVDFYWETTGEWMTSWGTDQSGNIEYFGTIAPYLRIPITASLGTQTIRAVGNVSKQTVFTEFNVVERTVFFDPSSGSPGDTIITSGCGWVGNSQVIIEWGYPDPNNLPIRWSTLVDPMTGCFGSDGNFTITVPANTISGDITVTATGDVEGETQAIFDVFSSGQFSLLTTSGYASDAIDVQIINATVGETINFSWGFYTYMNSVGAATPDFITTLTIPENAKVGDTTIYATGTKGFNDSENFTVLDGSQISVSTAAPFYAGNLIEVQGTGWAATEGVYFKLSLDGVNWVDAGFVRVSTDVMTFTTNIRLPYDLNGGSYTLRANGDRGRTAETTLDISEIAFYAEADYASPAPDLDGNLRVGEWPIENAINFVNGSMVVSNDENRLYVLLNVEDDYGQDAVGADNFWLSFDIWNDDKIDASWDLNFRLDLSGDFILEEYDGLGGFDPRNSAYLRSAYAPGFGCFFADGSRRLSFDGFFPSFQCDNHRVWEIAIDLQTLGIIPGDIVRMGVRLISEMPGFTEDIPSGFTSDFGGLGVILLSPPQLGSLPEGELIDIGVDGYTIEVTQAVQKADNSVKLVANKATAVRVFPAVQAESAVRVFLYGQRDGVDLPGSPLVTTAIIPPTPDLDFLENTANFLLPPSWTTAGVTSLTAIAERLDGTQTTAETRSAIFYDRRVPNYWIVPVNIGSESSPNLPTSSEIALQQSYLETTFPLHDVNWTLRPWQDLGEYENFADLEDPLDVILDDLETLYANTALTFIYSGKTNQIPEHIYGFLTDSANTGGLSTGGDGVVAAGSRGGSSSLEGVMAHEINHNLDNKQSTTWGRHVTDDDDTTTNLNWGCSAKVGDPAWEAVNGADDEIGDRGFDTRQPWQLGNGAIRTVIPSNYPDLMSYCRSESESNGVDNQLPTKWISSYRWDALFNEYAPRTTQLQENTRVTADEVLYISGELYKDGTGQLDPVRILPGISTPVITPGDYSLEVRDVTGMEVLLSVPFIGSFINIEHEEVEIDYFNFQIPFPEGGAQVVLLNGEEVLDMIEASASLPIVSIISPMGGENWVDEAVITWDASDADGDALSFSLFYSPDEGVNWYPIKSDLTGNSYAVDVSRLPGGTGGRIRIIATDGFHTVTADSTGTFSVPDPGVNVVIQSPITGSIVPAGALINLVGIANEITGELFDQALLVWSVDGEPIDVGNEAEVQLLPGVYTITLTAYGDSGQRGSDSVEITMVANGEDPGNKIFLPLIIR